MREPEFVLLLAPRTRLTSKLPLFNGEVPPNTDSCCSSAAGLGFRDPDLLDGRSPGGNVWGCELEQHPSAMASSTRESWASSSGLQNRTLGFMKTFNGLVSILLQNVSPDKNIPSGRRVRPAREVPHGKTGLWLQRPWGNWDKKTFNPPLRVRCPPSTVSCGSSAGGLGFCMEKGYVPDNG